MAKADLILVEWLGNDDVIDMGEVAALREIGDAAKTTGFLICRCADFDPTGKVRIGRDKGLCCVQVQ